MSKYTIKQDCKDYDTVEDLAVAIELAEQLLGGVSGGEGTTFTVENESSHLRAVVTSRRILGTFTKQAWNDHDDAVEVGLETFDATDHVLLMSHDRLMALQDGAEISDDIGLQHVSWSGPCHVSIVDSVRAYFGVDDIEDITPDALAYAKNRASPQPPAYETVTLNVTLKVRVMPGARVNEFIDEMDYSFTSNTVGVCVVDTCINSAD